MGKFVILLGGKPMRLAIYQRVSTKDQSLEHQERAINSWIEEQGYNPSSVIRFSDDGVSGAVGQLKRRGYAKLLEAVVAGKVERVLMFETSRASRDFMEYLRFLELCSQHKTEVEVIGKGLQSFATSQDMLLASVHAFLNQAEREKISERTRSGLKAARARGARLGAPAGNSNRLGRCKEYSAELVAAIQRLAKHGLSNRAIAVELGSRFTPRQISYNTVRQIRLRHSI
jgi:DNA invertase Pin-like site-specific DNA recombinase